MPTLTRWFVKTALVCFIIALGLGTVMYTESLRAELPVLAVIWPAYLHLLMVGWITGLIMGVAYWLFPRPSRSQPAASDRFGWLAYALLNSGLLLRVIAEPATALDRLAPLRWLLPVSGLLQLGGACAFATLIWPRVKAR